MPHHTRRDRHRDERSSEDLRITIRAYEPTGQVTVTMADYGSRGQERIGAWSIALEDVESVVQVVERALRRLNQQTLFDP